MRPLCATKKRSSTPSPKRRKRARKKGAKRKAPKRKAPKRKAPKRKAPKRKTVKRKVAKRTPSGISKRVSKRSAAKKKRLLEAMADLRMHKRDGDAQPPGWIEHRRQLRMHDGKIWRRIENEFDQKAYDAIRLSTLADLEIDFLTRDELYDYMTWASNELEIDISDMYRMYLGYPVGQSADLE